MIVVFFQWSTNPEMAQKETRAKKDKDKEESTELESNSRGSESIEKEEATSIHELGKNFFFLIANYQQFELLEYYIKPKSPFDNSNSSPLEK